MAHEYAMKHLENSNGNITIASLKSFAWEYAEAMQAEAEKRNRKPLPAVQQTFVNGVEQPRYAPSLDEWQPDWSQAPRDINYWFKNGKQSCWSVNEPELVNGIGFYAIGFNMEDPSFGYQGDWKDSLRKRPD